MAVGELEPSALRRFRERKGWRQIDLANAAGLSAAYVNQLERGNRKPSALVMYTLARVLDVSIEDLTGEDIVCPVCGSVFRN